MIYWYDTANIFTHATLINNLCYYLAFYFVHYYYNGMYYNGVSKPKAIKLMHYKKD